MNESLPTSISNCQYKTYLIGSMESPGLKDEGITWRRDISEKLKKIGIFSFDPTKEESKKSGLTTPDFINLLNECLLSQDYFSFISKMEKIWKGSINFTTNEETGESEVNHLLGDLDFVEHSDFIIWYLHPNDKLGGTVAEVFLAWQLRKPIYLITEMKITDINKSLLYFVLDSGGNLSNDIEDFIYQLESVYDLKLCKE